MIQGGRSGESERLINSHNGWVSGHDHQSEVRKAACIISNDKAYDIEFGNAKEELRARTEFNRRLLNLEITLLAATVAVLAASNAGVFVNAYLIQTSCALVLWIAVAFAVENYSNNFFIIKAAQFQHYTLNQKYQLIDERRPVFEWEIFIAAERQHSPRRANRYMFIADAPFILNIVMTVLAIAGYIQSLWTSRNTVFLVPLFLMLMGCFAIAFCYWSHFQPLSGLNALVSREESAAFTKRYALISR